LIKITTILKKNRLESVKLARLVDRSCSL